MVEKWFVGPPPPLRSTPMVKVLSMEQLDILHETAGRTKPFSLELVHFRVVRVRRGDYAPMVALEAVFEAEALEHLKIHWLSNLGAAVEDLEAQLYDRGPAPPRPPGPMPVHGG